MRVMLVHPGAQFSTSDVYDGYAAGLAALGVDVLPAPLDRYIAFAGNGAAAMSLDGANVIALAGAFVAQRALIERPDLLVAVGGTNLHRGTAAALTAAGVRTAIILLDSPYLWDVESALAPAYRYVATNERTAVGPLRDACGHSRVRYLPTAYHPLRHTPDGPTLPTPSDVSFIGSLFPERRALLDVADFAGLRVQIGGLALDAPMELRRAYHNDGVAALYRSTRVNLNLHRTTMVHGDGRRADGAESLGPRAYELAACGAFALTDDARPELRDVFGGAAATFRAGDADDLGRQVRRWLADDAGRERLAREQRDAVQQGHSYTDRARALLEWAVD